MLKNLDLAIDAAIFEGEQVLKKYDSLYFYLKKIAFGHINTFKAGRQLGGEDNPFAEEDMSKDEKQKRRKKLADIARVGTIAVGGLGGESLLNVPGGGGLLNIPKVPTLQIGKAQPGVRVDGSARQSARMVNAP